MAKVKIQGNASGTGVITLIAPNTNTDRTVTLPDATGTLLTANGDGSSLTGMGVTTLNAVTNITVSTSNPVISTNPSATGYLWINKTLGELFICTDATTGANSWINIGRGSGHIA
jgi:hypothetical protein